MMSCWNGRLQDRYRNHQSVWYMLGYISIAHGLFRWNRLPFHEFNLIGFDSTWWSFLDTHWVMVHEYFCDIEDTLYIRVAAFPLNLEWNGRLVKKWQLLSRVESSNELRERNAHVHNFKSVFFSWSRDFESFVLIFSFTCKLCFWL